MRGPSKKIIIIGAVALVLITAVFLMTRENITTYNSPNAKTSLKTTNTTAGSYNFYSGASVAPQTVSNSNANATNTTEKIGSILANEYFQLKNSDTNLDTTTKNLLIDSVVAQNSDSTSAKVYASSDLKIASAESVATIKSYGNSMGSAIVTSSPKIKDNELSIVQNYIKTNDAAELQKLDPIIQSYKNIISKSLAIAVPKSAVSVNLQYLNGLSLVLKRLEDMRVLNDDPIRGMSGASNYQASVASLAGALQNVYKYFVSKGVTFQQGESGYHFAHEI